MNSPMAAGVFSHKSLGRSKLQDICSLELGQCAHWVWKATGRQEHWQGLCQEIEVKVSCGYKVRSLASLVLALLIAEVVAAEQRPAQSISQALVLQFPAYSLVQALGIAIQTPLQLLEVTTLYSREHWISVTLKNWHFKLIQISWSQQHKV